MPRDRLPPIEFETVDNGPISSSSSPEPGDEHTRHRPRGPWRGVVAASAAVLGLVTVAILDQPSHDSSARQSSATTSAPASHTARFEPASPRTSWPPGPTHFTASSYLLEIGTGRRTPLPAGLEEGFSLSGTYVSSYVPSPDGTRVIVVYQCAWPLVGCAWDGRIAVGNIDGSYVRTITPPDGAKAGWASWSPDGARIVYEATVDLTSSRQLVIEDVTTGAQNQVTHLKPFDGAWLLSPTFALDGQSVLFMLPDSDSDRCCASDVWSVPVTGGEPTLVITDAAFPAPLSDGKTLVYVSGGGIWAASIEDPGSARPVAYPFGVLGLWASPDGTRLAYARAYGRPGGPPPTEPGGVNVVDLRAGVTEYVVDRGGASWLDNDTLIVTEVTPD